jgi:Mrp family chromosome partitioning ATPase
MPDQAVLNAYRELRTKLMQASAGANFVCMVSSLSRDASATAVAANLAASIAIDKTKTAVLIDCDLNGPGTEQYTVVRAMRGVTDYLDDPSLELTQIIYPSGVRRFRVIPLGNSVEHSAEHFASPSMYRFISSVKTRYPDRFVIVIAPPIATSAEAKILTESCDLAILVMPYGKVVESQLQAAAAMVPEHKLAGIVFPPEQ